MLSQKQIQRFGNKVKIQEWERAIDRDWETLVQSSVYIRVMKN